jgi:two-component system heavy metal sensor histidine kinase CusS
MSSKSGIEPQVQRPWSLALRLTAYYSISAFFIVAVATSSLYWAMIRNVDLEDDRTLADKVRLLQSILRESPRDDMAIRQEVNESWQAGQHTVVFIRVVASDGTIVAESPGMNEILPSALFPETRSDMAAGSNVEIPSRKSYRVMSAADSQGGFVHVALDRTPELELLAGYEESLWYALGVAIVVCTLAGYVIAWRGLKPIREISSTVGEIRPGNLGRRIKLSGLPSELHLLASGFNDMLDRLEAAFNRLSQFSGDLAHELRTPLYNLKTSQEVALTKQRTPEEYVESIASGLEECQRLERMIDSLLFLARAEDPKRQVEREPIAIGDEISHIREFFDAMAAEREVQLHADLDRALKVNVNRPLLQRAVGNLISNALNHTAAGGVITLRTMRQGDRIVVEVADTGCGISDADLPQVFDRFYRADRSRSSQKGGVGLGLAIVKSIMELHGGNVQIVSAPGRGTCVALSFPADQHSTFNGSSTAPKMTNL